MIQYLKQTRRSVVHRIMQGILSDAAFSKYWYWKRFRKPLDLRNPRTFNEKIHWLKLHRRKPIIKNLSDKHAVRGLVEERIGAEYLIPMIDVFERAQDICFEKLPGAFVLKCNHGSGLNWIVRDKARVDEAQVRVKFEDWLKRDYSRAYREWNYRDIPRKIVCEELLPGDAAWGGRLHDFKIFCFNGQPHFVQVDVDRQTEHKRSIYDLGWVKQDFTFNHSRAEEIIGKPTRFDEMIAVARTLAEGFDLCRVDLYQSGDRVYFGELTFYPEGGYCEFDPETYDEKLGALIDLGDAGPSVRLATG